MQHLTFCDQKQDAPGTLILESTLHKIDIVYHLGPYYLLVANCLIIVLKLLFDSTLVMLLIHQAFFVLTMNSK